MTRTARIRLRQRIEAFAALVGIVALTGLALLASIGAARSDESAPRPTVTVAGDDNRDGVVDEDESGWDCQAMGNRQCGSVPPECQGEDEFPDVCAMVAERPAYTWTDARGAAHHVPDGRTLLAGIDLPRGSEAFQIRLFELDAEYVERALHNE